MFNRKLLLLTMLVISGMAALAMSKMVSGSPLPQPKDLTRHHSNQVILHCRALGPSARPGFSIVTGQIPDRMLRIRAQQR